MLLKDRSSSLKLVILYLFYNVCLKIFFSLFNHLLYIEYPEDIKQLSFFVIKDNFLSAFIENLFRVISSDLFWLLPYTIMNIYIFVKLINYLIKENRDVYQYMSFVILKVYFFWCIVYLCSIGFGFFLENGGLGSLLGGVASPYGGYTITYLLLGNFVFVLLFVPLWNKIVKNWVFKTKP